MKCGGTMRLFPLLSTLVLMLPVCIHSQGCLTAPSAATNQMLLSNNTHLRELFNQFGDGENLTMDGVVKMLETLGLTRGGEEDQHGHDAHDDHDHEAHDDHAHEDHHDHEDHLHDDNTATGKRNSTEVSKECGSVKGVLPHLKTKNLPLTPLEVYASCPSILHYLLLSRSYSCSLNDPEPTPNLLPVLDRRQDHRDPHYDPYDRQYGPRSNGYNPSGERYGPRDPGPPRNYPSNPSNPAFDNRGPGFDNRGPGFDNRGPGGYGPVNNNRNKMMLPPVNPENPGYDPTGKNNYDFKHGTRITPKKKQNRDRMRGNMIHSHDLIEQAFDGERKRPLPPTANPQERILDHPQDQLYGGGTKIDTSRRNRHPDRRNKDYDDNYPYEDRSSRWDAQESPYARWVGGVVSMILIGCISLACTMVLPALRKTRHYDQANHFLLSLAVGTLAGDALIHLLPHAISMGTGDHHYNYALSDHNDHDAHLHEHHGSHHFKQALYGFTALGGIIIFLFLERLHNIRSGGKGHGHSHGARMDGPPMGGMDTTLPRNATLLLSDSHLDVVGLPPSQKIGKKLSEHSKEDLLNIADPSRCFGGCPKNQPSSASTEGLDCVDRGDSVSMMGGFMGTSDVGRPVLPPSSRSAHSTLRRDQVLTVRREPLKDRMGGSTVTLDQAERERLMNPHVMMAEKLSSDVNEKKDADRDSVNIVLQEYHVSHHGHSHHGHAHVSGRKDSLKMMILMGECMHIVMDGMAIGAAFATSLTGGIATAIAVLCHEIPHKVGDFALLFDMGMTRKKAIQVVLIMWVLSVCGMVAGELVGSIESASPWIYSFTAGIFLHLALVDLLSEVSVKGAESCSAAGQIFLQICGMVLGACIMLLIALYEHDLHNLLAGSI